MRQNKKKSDSQWRSKETPLALWVLCFAWALFVCWKFYSVSPFPLGSILKILASYTYPLIPTASAIKIYVMGFFWASLFALGSWFLGQCFLRRTFSELFTPMERAIFSTAIGYAVWGFYSFLLGVFHKLSRDVFVLSLIGCLIGVAFLWVRNKKNSQPSAFKEFSAVLWSTPFHVLLSLCLGIIFLTIFVMAFVPEIFYDALVYHIGVPNFYLKAGGVEPIEVMPSKFPFLIQMIYLVGLALHGDIVTKLTHGFFQLLLAGGFVALGARFKNTTWGLLSALAFCALPTVQLNGWTSGIDIGVSLFGFLAVYCFVCTWQDEQNFQKWYYLSAIFSGLAVSSKYTVIYIPVVLFLSNIFLFIRRKTSFKKLIFMSMAHIFIVVTFLAPWLLRNWAHTGNPLYPFLSQVFGQTSIEPWRFENLRRENYGFTPSSIWEFIKIPWQLSINERTSLSFQGPLYLAMVPMLIALFFHERQSFLRKLILFSVIFLPVGLFMTRLTRYLLPGLTIVGSVIAYGVMLHIQGKTFLRKIATAGIFLFCVFQQVSWGFIILDNSYRPGVVLSGRKTREEYRRNYHPGMNPNPSDLIYEFLGKERPEANVLILGDEKGYPCPVRHSYSGVYDVNPLIRLCNESRSSEEVFTKISKAGFTHLLVNVHEIHRLAGYGILAWTKEGFEVFQEFWIKYVQLDHVESPQIMEGVQNMLLLYELTHRKTGSPPYNFFEQPYKEFISKRSSSS